MKPCNHCGEEKRIEYSAFSGCHVCLYCKACGPHVPASMKNYEKRKKQSLALWNARTREEIEKVFGTILRIMKRQGKK